MKLETKYISPQMAEDLLKTNPINRRVAYGRVLTYVNQMRQKKWMLNGETIKVSDTGKLLDGQHRLYAIVEYGAPVEMSIVTGMSEDAFKTIDTGSPRRASQIAAMAGIQNSVVVTAASMIVYRLFMGGGREASVPPSEIITVARAFPAFQKWGGFIKSQGNASPLPAACLLGAIVYLEDIAKKPRLAEEFFKGMQKGEELKNGSPVLALRNAMLSARGRGSYVDAFSAWAPTARAIDALEAGDHLERILIVGRVGSLRRPKLWDTHTAALPNTQKMNEVMRAPDGRNHTKRRLFQDTVTAIREEAEG